MTGTSSIREQDLLLDDLTRELQLYVKTNSPHKRAMLDLPVLRSLSTQNPDTPTIAEMVDTSVGVVTERPEGFALTKIFLPSDELWETNLVGRQRQAAVDLGVSFDSFRRRRNRQPSSYDELCTTLAAELLSRYNTKLPIEIAEHDRGAPEPATPQTAADAPAAASAAAGLSKRWRTMAFAGLVLLGGLAAVVLWPNGSDSLNGESITAENGCVLAQPDSDIALERARAAIEGELVRRGTPACLSGELEESKGFFFYHFDERISEHGGAVVRSDPDGGYTVGILPLVPWLSYMGLAVNDGGTVIDLAGFATGEIVPSHGGYTIVTDGGGYFHSESPFSVFYWMPTAFYDTWIEEGAEDGPLGSPASFVGLVDGSWRVDFTNGALAQLATDGSLETQIAEDVRDLSLEKQQVAGTIIMSRQQDAWFVDGEMRRWQIPTVSPVGLPDHRVFECAGGIANVSVDSLDGGTIHQLEFAGVASCPLDTVGVHPRQGHLGVEGYCWTQGKATSVVSAENDAIQCVQDGQVTDVDPAAICAWQYGPGAELQAVPDGLPLCTGADR